MTDETDIKEVLERTRRIETRVTRLARHVGADKDEAPVQVDSGVVVLQGLDVPLSTILRVARLHNLRGRFRVVVKNIGPVCTLEDTREQ